MKDKKTFVKPQVDLRIVISQSNLLADSGSSSYLDIGGKGNFDAKKASNMYIDLPL